MTEERKTTGNIVDAIKALQQGARVSDVGGVEVVLLNRTLVWAEHPTTAYLVSIEDVEKDAFAIQWPAPRKPKRGEVWGHTCEYIILAKVHNTYLVYCPESTWFNILEHTITEYRWRYIRDATPEEMAQFDGGSE